MANPGSGEPKRLHAHLIARGIAWSVIPNLLIIMSQSKASGSIPPFNDKLRGGAASQSKCRAAIKVRRSVNQDETRQQQWNVVRA
ncbi:hypothetical protein AJ87_11185 [Rhizobium yanglingense]|nr:hypothetical protein AJ87_11185 [Rhizobium yanglingense]